MILAALVNKDLRREEQNKFSKKVTSSGDWTWDPKTPLVACLELHVHAFLIRQAFIGNVTRIVYLMKKSNVELMDNANSFCEQNGGYLLWGMWCNNFQQQKVTFSEIWTYSLWVVNPMWHVLARDSLNWLCSPLGFWISDDLVRIYKPRLQMSLDLKVVDIQAMSD